MSTRPGALRQLLTGAAALTCATATLGLVACSDALPTAPDASSAAPAAQAAPARLAPDSADARGPVAARGGRGGGRDGDHERHGGYQVVVE